MLKHTLFIGLNDKDSKQQEISTVNAVKIILNCAKAYYDGATVQEATGFYKMQDGSLIIENSLQLSILFADDKKTRALIDDLKNLLNQESIALQVENITSELI